MKSITVVIPCYNEESRLPIASFRKFSEKYRDVTFLFVDDGSNDKTPSLLRGLNSKDPDRFHVLSLERNKGKGEAVRQGILRALSYESAFVGYWDADLSTPLTVIPLFVDVFETRPGTEVVLGARLKSLGRCIERRPSRHYGGRIIATAISLITGLYVYDSQCGAKLFRRTKELVEVFSTSFVSRWLFDVEVLLRVLTIRRAQSMQDINRLLYELPLPEWYHAKGSKITFWDCTCIPIELYRIRMAYGSLFSHLDRK
jgi:glycosyltransferase involved in cell wall biosynthesis